MNGGEIFVPKMRSFVVADVLAALAPKCRVKVIGIRPREKLHEILITEHEALRTRDVGKVFVVKPEFLTGMTTAGLPAKKSFLPISCV